MGSADSSSWVAQDLSIDQKPDQPEEQGRIEGEGCYVSRAWARDPARVWSSATAFEKRVGHNLAMARSIGDHDLPGISAEAEVTMTQITTADQCLILASDGVWEFISSQEAVDICYEHRHNATDACRVLISKATSAWWKQEGYYRDDITAIVVFLPVLGALQRGMARNSRSGRISSRRADRSPARATTVFDASYSAVPAPTTTATAPLSTNADSQSMMNSSAEMQQEEGHMVVVGLNDEVASDGAHAMDVEVEGLLRSNRVMPATSMDADKAESFARRRLTVDDESRALQQARKAVEDLASVA